jgi:hypothetical protein
MRRLAVLALSLTLLLGLLPAAGAVEEAGGRSERAEPEEFLERVQVRRAARTAAVEAAPAEIPDPPVEENIDLPPGLIAYHEIAGVLRDLRDRSDRVSVEVFGQSAGGRDLYLVTIADPEYGDLEADLAFRSLMVEDPERAAEVAAANPGLRSPVWVHASIHGNEWEGTDAALELAERLATAEDEETLAVLREHVVLLNIVANPDGRVQGTRRNASDIDLNRDFITRSEPETRATVEQFVKWNPAAVYDLHGYVNPYLFEPTTAPHNPNYEYDLYIRHALPAAQSGQANVVAEGVPIEEPEIPFEDYPRGDWDDWPPIFTPMYAMYHGSIGHTMETPLRQNGRGLTLPPEERRRQGEINTAAHVAATWGAIRYMTANAQQVMLDQIEVFRRGAAAEPPASDPFLEPPGNSAGFPSPREDYTADPPAAYLIPAGAGQESAAAAVRLVEHLLANGVEVGTARAPFRADGRWYPRGTYVVDMAQGRRGLANTMLEPGYDLTPVSPQMYDISGWSLAELWGATVVPVESTPRVPPRRLTEPVQGVVSAAPGAAGYALELTDPSAIRAVNALLDQGVEVVRLADGRAAVAGDAYADLAAAAGEEGLDVSALRAAPEGEPLEDLRVAISTALNEELTLLELGFDVTYLEDLAALSADDYDVLAYSGGAPWEDLEPAAQTAVTAFLAEGGGLVAWTRDGAAFNEGAGALDVDYAFADIDATPNGVGYVTHARRSPVVAGYPLTDTTFVFDPLWFPEVGVGVRVDERYGDGDFFFAGHWIGQEEAAGQPSVVSGDTAQGGRAVLFGTDPLFRDHPKGLYGQMAQALHWADGD